MAQKKRQSTVSRKAKRSTHSPRAIVGIGASAGGLEAITEILENLPAKTGMAFVYVQHLDPTHKSLLTPILSRIAPFPVQEAKQGTRVEADHLYIIPPNKNMLIKDGVLRLVTRVGGEGRLISIDNFFRSLASDQKNRAIGIILSGNASDGVLGLEAIKGEGGITMAQEKKSAKHPSMPHNAIISGAADKALVPAEIARELDRISRHPYVAPLRGAASTTMLLDEQKSFQMIFEMLRKQSGVNFFNYKPPTLRRRISRRMVLQKIEDFSSYGAFLKKNPAEVEALFQDLLINVTEFFRDHDTFDHLKRYVFPALMKVREKSEPIRIWSAGCSTGEEAYSLAIALVEFQDSTKRTFPFQIFGSDLSELNITKARAGVYPASIATDVSPERLRRFFTKINGHYQISKAIRDVCIFAKQDLVNDPPFSQLDLIACRNVLIYLEPIAQKRILPTFHYALKPKGILLLGRSEGVGEFSDLFLVKQKMHKVYEKKLSSRRPHFRAFSDDGSNTGTFKPSLPGSAKPNSRDSLVISGLESDLSKEADRILLTGFVHPSVVIDDELQIVQFRGDLSPYLNLPAGKATWNLLKMAQGDLLMELRRAIADVKKKSGRSCVLT